LVSTIPIATHWTLIAVVFFIFPSLQSKASELYRYKKRKKLTKVGQSFCWLIEMFWGGYGYGYGYG
jgi:hypothetical protein